LQHLFEGMFLLDNQAVRTDWAAAKSVVTDLLSKHGAKVLTARRWDERPLAYKIRGRRRATFLLVFFEHQGPGVATVRRDLDIEERILRYLILSVDEVPAGEAEASQAELAAGFSVPPPPADDEVILQPVEPPKAEEDQVEEAPEAVAEVEA
jgi:small subunit ribosomal protein S6